MKVLVVDNHPIVANGCRILLDDLPDLEVHFAGSLDEGAAKFAEIAPDVAVVDVNFPDGNGYDLTRQIVSSNPAARILIFTMCDGPLYAAHALEAGAMGYLSKNSDPLKLRSAIVEVAGGSLFVPDDLMQEVVLRKATADPAAALTERDKQILRLLADGATPPDAASQMGIAYKTVLRACARMRESLGANNQVDLIQKALRLNLI